ncbi:MAG: hypothetical protein KatS3mg008_0468 [Acidimicrobiales bacterium]|nr:MAG: hypothetical protein KatS3mg008_0468 [Acidimicrobiales bacterium]
MFVLGMHRSGTSATTGLLESLGLIGPDPRRRFAPTAYNARGNQEHVDLTERNERLLQHFGGRWDAPPDLPEHWVDSPTLLDWRPEAQRLFDEAIPGAPWVWKDPRLSITLPFWENILVGRHLFVLAVRHPVAVAESLTRRNRLRMPVGVALWEHYNLSALRLLSGRRCFVQHYDDLVEDPQGAADALAGWLREHDMVPPAGSTPGDVALPDPSLRHQTMPAQTDEDTLTPQQSRLWDLIRSLEGEVVVPPHSSLPQPHPLSVALLAERRDLLAQVSVERERARTHMRRDPVLWIRRMTTLVFPRKASRAGARGR